jgi:hypothetical protein
MDFQDIIDELKDRRGNRLDIESILTALLVRVQELDEELNELKEQLKLTGKE